MSNHKWQVIGKRFDRNGNIFEHTFGYWPSLRDLDAEVMGGKHIWLSFTGAYGIKEYGEWLTWHRFYSKSKGEYVAYDSDGNEYQLWAERVW